MKTKNKKILVFSAHPDDHLCCAGTLMYLKGKGYNICEIVATGGESGVWFDSNNKKKSGFDKNKLAQERKKEISKASKIIGVSETVFLGLPDSKVEKTHEVIENIIKIIRKEKPEIVITHNSNDYHPDHKAVNEIVLEAAERASWTYLPEFGNSYKIPIILLMEGFYLGRSDLVFDITKYKKRKESLLDVYGSQIYPSERKMLESMNNYRSFFLRGYDNIDCAEAFEIPDHFPVYMNRVLEIFSKK